MPLTLAEAEHNYDVFSVIILWNSIISIVASLITLYLMIRLKVYQNRLMFIIFVMTLLQCLYDIFLIPFCGKVGTLSFDKCRAVQLGVGMWTGVSSAMCTCVISGLVSFVIVTRKAVVLTPLWLFNIVMTPGLLIGTLAGIYYYWGQVIKVKYDHTFETILAVYDFVRIGQIVINVLCMMAIIYVLWSIDIICSSKVRALRSTNSNSMGTSSGSRSSSMQRTLTRQSLTPSHVSKTAYPMFLLAMRLIWYPVAQCITRFGASWYQFSTGRTVSSYISIATVTPTPKLLTTQLIIYGLFTPIAGLFYFLIFLVVQRGAWHQTQKLLCWCCFDIKQAPQSRNDLRNSISSIHSSIQSPYAHDRDTEAAAARTLSGVGAGDTRLSASSARNSYYDEDEDNEYTDLDGIGNKKKDSNFENLAASASTAKNSFATTARASSARMNDPPSLAAAGSELRLGSDRLLGSLTSVNLAAAAAHQLARGGNVNLASSDTDDIPKSRSSLFGQSGGVTNVDVLVHADPSEVTNAHFDELDEDELYSLIAKQDEEIRMTETRVRGGIEVAMSAVASASASASATLKTSQASSARPSASSIASTSSASASAFSSSRKGPTTLNPITEAQTPQYDP